MSSKNSIWGKVGLPLALIALTTTSCRKRHIEPKVDNTPQPEPVEAQPEKEPQIAPAQSDNTASKPVEVQPYPADRDARIERLVNSTPEEIKALRTAVANEEPGFDVALLTELAGHLYLMSDQDYLAYYEFKNPEKEKRYRENDLKIVEEVREFATYDIEKKLAILTSVREKDMDDAIEYVDETKKEAYQTPELQELENSLKKLDVEVQQAYLYNVLIEEFMESVFDSVHQYNGEVCEVGDYAIWFRRHPQNGIDQNSSGAFWGRKETIEQLKSGGQMTISEALVNLPQQSGASTIYRAIRDQQVTYENDKLTGVNLLTLRYNEPFAEAWEDLNINNNGELPDMDKKQIFAIAMSETAADFANFLTQINVVQYSDPVCARFVDVFEKRIENYQDDNLRTLYQNILDGNSLTDGLIFDIDGETIQSSLHLQKTGLENSALLASILSSSSVKS